MKSKTMEKLFAAFATLTMLFAMGTTSVFAAEIEEPAEVVAASEDGGGVIMPTGTIVSNQSFNLTTTGWTSVGGQNNIFAKNIACNNHANNQGAVTFRVLNGNGVIIGAEQACDAGGNVGYYIPGNSGKFDVQAKANWSDGSYQLSVTD